MVAGWRLLIIITPSLFTSYLKKKQEGAYFIVQPLLPTVRMEAMQLNKKGGGAQTLKDRRQ